MKGETVADTAGATLGAGAVLAVFFFGMGACAGRSTPGQPAPGPTSTVTVLAPTPAPETAIVRLPGRLAPSCVLAVRMLDRAFALAGKEDGGITEIEDAISNFQVHSIISSGGATANKLEQTIHDNITDFEDTVGAHQALVPRIQAQLIQCKGDSS